VHSSRFLGGPMVVQCEGNKILPSDFRLKGGSLIYKVKYQHWFLHEEPVLITLSQIIEMGRTI
jgi:hypothetical protein